MTAPNLKLVNEVIRLKHEEGKSFTDISNILRVPRTTVRNWYAKYSATQSYKDVPVKVTTYNDISTEFSAERADKVLQFIESLAPIHYPAPKTGKVDKTPTKTAMVIGDMHFGAEDWNVLNIFLEAVSILRTSKIVLNGDTLDMFAISRYPKDVRYFTTLQHEREEYHKFLKLLHDAATPQTTIYETNANHSGNGCEGRWWRYLSDNIGDIATLPDIQEKLSYESIFLPPKSWSRVELVDYVEIVPGFVVMHGDVVRKHGGYSARGLLEKWYTSIIANHTHRIGLSSQRIPSIGTRPERVITVYENGCACNLKPLYASAVNWQNSFSIVVHDDDRVGVEQVIIENNKANICTIGKTLRAS